MKIILNGACGRMGRTIAEIVEREDGVEIAAGVDRFIGDRGYGFKVYARIEECAEAADVVVDFSKPEALSGLLEYCVERKLGLVLSTTGYSEDDIKHIGQAAEIIPIFRSANMAVGINLMADLAQRAAAFYGDGVDIEIVETHHRGKVDAPSGTAVLLANAINESLNNSEHYTYGRHGNDTRRKPHELGIHAVRGGTVVGEHEIMFLGDDERITLAHSAQSRAIFAHGALQAAQFLCGKPARLYDMRDLLVERSTVTNVYVERNVAMITGRDIDMVSSGVAGMLATLAEENINIDMISQTPPRADMVDISVSIPEREGYHALEILRGKYPELKVELCDHRVKVTAEGQGMQRQTGVAARIFGLMSAHGVVIELITTSETKVSMLVPELYERRAAQALREAFELN